jgi:hypothetical protein
MKNTQPPYNITKILDKIGIRAFDTPYTNLTGKSMFVLISGYYTITVAGNELLLRARHEFYPGGGLENMAKAGMQNTLAAEIGSARYFQLTMVVPPGCQYELYHETFGGTSTLQSWIEAY